VSEFQLDYLIRQLEMDENVEQEQGLGFALICRQCDNIKNITVNVDELFDGENIDITNSEIYCTYCGNKIK